MSALSAATQYKKQEGTLAISKDGRTATWTPAQPPNSAPALSIKVANVTNLQQTPEDKPKVMLKVFVKEDKQPEPVSHVFQFTAKDNPRAEANAIRDGLSKTINQATSEQIALQARSGGQSAAMAMASAISGGRSVTSWEDDERLLQDVKLQQAYLKENPELQKTLLEAKNEKPDSLSLLSFTKQFWASRVHLLRAYALAQAQNRAKFNVFSEISRNEGRERDEDGNPKMNLTVELIRALFEQFPVMRLVYDEVVPKRIKEDKQFWQRFLQSQLYFTLRGDKVNRRLDAKDLILDTYLDHPLMTGARPTSDELHLPKFIDLEGNEENHSRRQGNRPDLEQREDQLNKAPVIRKLNAMSEKLMAAVRPSDVDASAPIGVGEHEYEELRLRDLAGQPEQERIKLNIRDQARFFSDTTQSDQKDQVHQVHKLDPSKAIGDVLRDFTEHFSNPSKAVAELDLPVDDDDEMLDGEDNSSRAVSGATLANSHILSLIKAHRDQTSDMPGDANDPKREQKASGLSEAIYDRLKLVHATTLEFLRQYWHAFLSGDPNRVEEIASLAESLVKAVERIEAIATDAQNERNERLKEARKMVEEHYKKTGSKRRIDTSKAGAGEAGVKQLLGPILVSLKTAIDRYQAVHAEQLAELAQTQNGEGG